MDAPREFIPARPDYLADLTTITNSGTVRGDLRLTQGGAISVQFSVILGDVPFVLG